MSLVKEIMCNERYKDIANSKFINLNRRSSGSQRLTTSILLVFFLVASFVVQSSCMRPLRFNHVLPLTPQESSSDHQIMSAERESSKQMPPIVINTWAFTEATKKAWEVLSDGGTALDAVEQGCTRAEELQSDGTVGFGGSPDENGETTLDAMIMDGETHDVGAVGCLREVKNAIGVARKIMEHTKHTFLVGSLATDFAVQMGFPRETLTTPESADMHYQWKSNNCQPNFWKNVSPDPSASCGPYSSITAPHFVNNSTISSTGNDLREIDRFNHDTIGMVALDSRGNIACGTSSNGARNKIPGRVGDAPIVGAGGYVDRKIGGAAATGDGDVMIRFLPSMYAVEKMGQGLSPTTAAQLSIARIAEYYPQFSGAIVAVNLQGDYGAACHRIENGFPYSVRNSFTGEVKTFIVHCTNK